MIDRPIDKIVSGLYNSNLFILHEEYIAISIDRCAGVFKGLLKKKPKIWPNGHINVPGS